MNLQAPSGCGPILLVDDDPLCLAMLSEVLQGMGYSCETANNGSEALDLIYEGDFRVVISDWQMPEMSGPELCRRIRQRSLSGYVYFILLTSLDRRDNLVAGLRAGADDFISKPFDIEELHVRLRVADRISTLESRNVIIFSLAKLAESRDSETGAHLERMREYSRILAQHLSTTSKYEDVIDADYVRAIYLTSPLHDIGKVGIPDRILLKPGKLTDAEFDVMKQHSLIGHDTLDAALKTQPSADYLRFARDIACSHHERFDGRGYPYGLSGTDIPLCGRLVALADVYDALTTKRVYKDAFSHAKARKIILEESGAAFDPDIVDAFLACENEILDTKRRLDDEFEVAQLSQIEQLVAAASASV